LEIGSFFRFICPKKAKVAVKTLEIIAAKVGEKGSFR
jgi:hypothetical protein